VRISHLPSFLQLSYLTKYPIELTIKAFESTIQPGFLITKEKVMTKTRLKGTLASSAGISTSPLPASPDTATTAPAVTATVPTSAVTPAAPKPRVTASALIEQDIEETFISYRVKLQKLDSIEEEIASLEGELDDLKDRYPRQYREVSDRLGIDLETPEKESKVRLPKLPELQLGQTAVLAILIALVALGIFWTWWNNPIQGSLPAATTVAQVEGNLTGFELLPTATSESVGMIIIPTPSTVAEATAVVEETAVPTAVPPTAKPKPPTAVPPTAVPPTAVPAPEFWDSNAIGVFEIKGYGGVCSGDKVGGVDGPVTIAFPANYGNVEVIWGRCVVNGGNAEQIAAEDSSAWGKNFVVRNAP
jgi:hypothetical protein